MLKLARLPYRDFGDITRTRAGFFVFWWSMLMSIVHSSSDLECIDNNTVSCPMYIEDNSDCLNQYDSDCTDGCDVSYNASVIPGGWQQCLWNPQLVTTANCTIDPPASGAFIAGVTVASFVAAAVISLAIYAGVFMHDFGGLIGEAVEDALVEGMAAARGTREGLRKYRIIRLAKSSEALSKWDILSNSLGVISFVFSVVSEYEFPDGAEVCMNSGSVGGNPYCITKNDAFKLAFLVGDFSVFSANFALTIHAYCKAHGGWVDESSVYHLEEKSTVTEKEEHGQICKRDSYGWMIALLVCSGAAEIIGVLITFILVFDIKMSDNDNLDSVARVALLAGASFFLLPTGSIVSSINAQRDVYKTATVIRNAEKKFESDAEIPANN